MIINDLEVRLILPKKDNSGKKIEPEILKKVAEKMSMEFEGVSIIPTVLGCWFNPKKGELECDVNTMMFSDIRVPNKISEKEYEEKVKRVINFMKELAKKEGIELGQASVMWGIDKVEVFFEGGKYLKELPEDKTVKVVFEKYL